MRPLNSFNIVLISFSKIFSANNFQVSAAFTVETILDTFNNLKIYLITPPNKQRIHTLIKKREESEQGHVHDGLIHMERVDPWIHDIIVNDHLIVIFVFDN